MSQPALYLVRTSSAPGRCAIYSSKDHSLVPIAPQIPLAIRLRWYVHIRHWRQALAAASVYLVVFALWELAVR